MIWKNYSFLFLPVRPTKLAIWSWTRARSPNFNLRLIGIALERKKNTVVSIVQTSMASLHQNNLVFSLQEYYKLSRYTTEENTKQYQCSRPLHNFTMGYYIIDLVKSKEFFFDVMINGLPEQIRFWKTNSKVSLQCLVYGRLRINSRWPPKPDYFWQW